MRGVKQVLALLCSGALAVCCAPAPALAGTGLHLDWRNPTKPLTKSQETYTKATLTRDSDGFFAALSADGKATFDTKIGIPDLEKIGISAGQGTLATTGGGSYKNPVNWGSTNGANFSFKQLVTITINQNVFDRAAALSYVNNNGAQVSYNKRDTIQAVLYAIGKTTQASGFDGKTMYRVVVDYSGTIDLTNTIFIYSNTWLQLRSNTVMKKQYQSPAVESALPDRADAKNRQIAYTNENLIRNTAGEYGGAGYTHNEKIILDGGTWDANIAQYNRAKLGDEYQSSLASFAHMKNLVVRNATLTGANLAHHLELSGVRDVSVSGCHFTQEDGAYANEAIQLEAVHSKGGVRESAPYDDTTTRDVVVYGNVFEDLSRGIGNHSNVLGRDSSRIYVYKNTFRNVKSQAVLTCGCRTMRIEDNEMSDVGNGVDIRFTWEDGPLNFYTPHAEDWTYKELVADGILNRNITVTGNKIAVASFPDIDQVESSGTGVFVKGQVLNAADLGTLKKAAGSYTLEGITLQGNTITSAIGKGIYLEQTRNVSVPKNKIQGIVASGKHGDGIYAKNSSLAAIAGNAIAGTPGWGIYLAGTSPSASITSNKVSVSSANPTIYASKASVLQKLVGNRLTTSGPYATKLQGKKTRAVTLKKKSRTSASGTSAPKVTLKAYVGKTRISTAKTSAKGKFKLKFKKKLAKKTTVELRYTDATKNQVRHDFTI